MVSYYKPTKFELKVRLYIIVSIVQYFFNESHKNMSIFNGAMGGRFNIFSCIGNLSFGLSDFKQATRQTLISVGNKNKNEKVLKTCVSY